MPSGNQMDKVGLHCPCTEINGPGGQLMIRIAFVVDRQDVIVPPPVQWEFQPCADQVNEYYLMV